MAMNNQHSGTLRTDQEANLARLDDFQVLTSDLRIQLHRLEKSGGTLRPLLENHVLTVLADISRKQLSGYGESFADAQGTAMWHAMRRNLGETSKTGADVWRLIFFKA